MPALLSTVGLVVLSLPLRPAASQSSWARYKPGTIRHILAAEHDAVVGDLQPNIISTTAISTEDFATVATVVYEDSIRPTPETHLTIMADWAASIHSTIEPRTLFAQEILVREDSISYWLPTQDSVIAFVRRSVKRGDPINAYVIYMGAEADRKHIDWVLAVNDVQLAADAPPPSQRELNGFLIGQHEDAIASSFAKLIQVDTTADGWIYRTYGLDRAHHAYMSFKFPKDRPHYTISVQVAGDSGTPMRPFLGVRLGDPQDSLVAHLKKPSSIEHEQNDLNLDLYSYDGRNYSIEVDSLGEVSSIEIFGDDGFPEMPADTFPALDSIAVALAARGEVALQRLAPDIEIYRSGKTIKFQHGALADIESDTTEIAKALFAGSQSVAAILAKPATRQSATGAIRLWDKPPAGWVWKFPDPCPLQEIVLKVVLGRWRVWEVRYR